MRAESQSCTDSDQKDQSQPEIHVYSTSNTVIYQSADWPQFPVDAKPGKRDENGIYDRDQAHETVPRSVVWLFVQRFGYKDCSCAQWQTYCTDQLEYPMPLDL